MATFIKRALLILVLLPVLGACANVGQVKRMVDPNKLNKTKLKSLPTQTTPMYRFHVSTTKNLEGKQTRVVKEVDKQFASFEQCMHIQDRGAEGRRNRIVVVDGMFECKYHRGRCNGEFDPEYALIIVTYKAFNKDGILPDLKHEWAHAYNILAADHSNLKEVKKCTKY